MLLRRKILCLSLASLVLLCCLYYVNVPVLYSTPTLSGTRSSSPQPWRSTDHVYYHNLARNAGNEAPLLSHPQEETQNIEDEDSERIGDEVSSDNSSYVESYKPLFHDKPLLQKSVFWNNAAKTSNKEQEHIKMTGSEHNYLSQEMLNQIVQNGFPNQAVIKSDDTKAMIPQILSDTVLDRNTMEYLSNIGMKNRFLAGNYSGEGVERIKKKATQYIKPVGEPRVTRVRQQAGKSRCTVAGNTTECAPTLHLPDVLIIGAKKAGTRALLEFLRLHPKVKAAKQELHYFDRHYHRGPAWYRKKLPPRLPGELTVEKTPAYLVSSQVPGRVRALIPHVKLLLVVREPAMRALSDYAQSISKHATRKTFTELVFSERSTGLVNVNWAPVAGGLYVRHLQRWQRYFPPSSIHVVSGENLVHNPAQEMQLVEKFLGLAPFITAGHFVFNKTKGFPCLRRESSLLDAKQKINNSGDTTSSIKSSNNSWDSTKKNINDVNNNYNSIASSIVSQPPFHSLRGFSDQPDLTNFSSFSNSALKNTDYSIHLLPLTELSVHENSSTPPAVTSVRVHCLGSTKGRDHPDVDPETFRILREFFKPFNHKFFRLIGKKFDWN